MVAKRQCSFCAQEIEPGTGTIFVKRDGTVYQFCSSSCRKQQLHLGRIGHRFRWTRAYELKRAAERSSAERGSVAPAAAARRPRAAAVAAEAPVAPGPSEPGPPPAPAEPAPAAARRPRGKSAGPPSPKPATKPTRRPPPKTETKAATKPPSDEAE